MRQQARQQCSSLMWHLYPEIPLIYSFNFKKILIQMILA
ncbi:hypothetical protein XHC_4200 [Xanthomonas hortorum pv. carotae str. M081]|nr:hypothetical protein XHC_4200 [Xanthomonas hortorum pv. carotae str. M081]